MTLFPVPDPCQQHSAIAIDAHWTARILARSRIGGYFITATEGGAFARWPMRRWW
jgi:hypothetical protein